RSIVCIAAPPRRRFRRLHYADILHEIGGKLFSSKCNVIIEYKRKSLCDQHFTSAKHTKFKYVPNYQIKKYRQTPLTESVQNLSLSDQICEDWISTCTAINIPLSTVINGRAIPGYHQLQENI
uniref:Uncharacterized protein n=1 Tax=Hippocampus comes TaxID=109280 RepID=A0A3Q2Y401_HIPCM